RTCDGLDSHECSNNVGGMGCHNQTPASPNSIIQTADVQCSIRPARHHGYVNTGCFKVTQRPHDGVVLHTRRYDVITGPDQAVNSEIECVRSVVRSYAKSRTSGGRPVKSGAGGPERSMSSTSRDVETLAGMETRPVA